MKKKAKKFFKSLLDWVKKQWARIKAWSTGAIKNIKEKIPQTRKLNLKMVAVVGIALVLLSMVFGFWGMIAFLLMMTAIMMLMPVFVNPKVLLNSELEIA